MTCNGTLTSSVIENNETDCSSACFESLNASGACTSSCFEYYYPNYQYGNCLICQTDEYDGGTFWSRQLKTCVNTCRYITNASTVSTPNVLGCEDESDPPDATRCPFYQYLNQSSFLCSSSCYSLVQGTRVCCPASLPLIPSAGSISCQATCSPAIYIMNGSIN